MNEQEKQYYSLLARKWFDGTITPEEKIIFNNWVDHLGTGDDIAIDDTENHLLKDSMKARLLAEIQESPSYLSDERHSSIYRIPQKKLVWRAAAVLIPIIFCLLVFLHNRRTKETQDTFSHALSGSPSHHPELILNSGQHIVLPDSSGAIVAGKTGSAMIRINNGVLSYKNASASSAPALNELSVPKGCHYQIVLPDGSHVWLNSASTLKFPSNFAANKRTVHLTGEGYFEVAHNALAPFTVETKKVKVQVLGTHFNVMAYDDENTVQTTLLKGSVQVVTNSDTKLIRPGEQASLADKSPSFAISTPDIDEVMAWQKGEFMFRNADIEKIMRQVARWYDLDINYKGSMPANRFNGVIPRKSKVEDLLTILEQTEQVHFVLKKKQLTVLPGKE